MPKKNRLLLGLHRHTLPVPQPVWQNQVEQKADGGSERRAFMSETHVLVHHHVVRELPKIGIPFPPERIAADLGLPLEQVIRCLGDLEKHMTFLFRNEKGDVVWAYPVTVEPTPHRLKFKSGESLYAA
jgi:hypothetical protein